MRSLEKLAIASFMLLSTNIIFAQQRFNRTLSPEAQQERIEKQVENYSDKLQLDDLQKALLKANLEEFSQKQLDILQATGTREEKRASLRDLRAAQDRELSEFLDDEQMTLFDQIRQNQREKRRGSRFQKRDPQ
ncbi:hypothetical protein ACFQ1M_05985 [Sungkyunkwania multivorans]|uniref:P pilus assembly/Cpx signaling pathway, periplasmic inhibitor/zinc-resistance associated protein n=1 Tax=Sungkyunkwania multivorans TaxID=1173618 RepID=A0ABW3CVI7_9FLAO